ncbi:MAG: hypothetical protein EBR82_85040 [Caulobacteraceae bacterium]|nr:hypothetical protein [Caulobacteraceae bacterium]
MKAILEYTLPDDQHEYDLANSASDMYNALYEINEKLRNLHKYGELNGEQLEIVDKIYQDFHDILIYNKIQL